MLLYSVKPANERKITALGTTETHGVEIQNPEHLKTLIASILDDNKAEDIEIIDLKGQTAIADYMIVATGRSNRQVVALADKLSEKLKAAGMLAPRVEGLPHGDWVVVDAFDVIIHLFRPEVRSFYNIEKMWRPEPTAETARAASH